MYVLTAGNKEVGTEQDIELIVDSLGNILVLELNMQHAKHVLATDIKREGK